MQAYNGPRRSSARVQGLQADGRMVEHEGPGGKISYESNPDEHRGPSVWSVAEPATPKERHPKGEALALGMTEENLSQGHRW